ncbi:MAG: glycosyl hydrolase family 25, partial [Prevotella sp.]|nr:glycosyl hydrolase family 25 [Prevotella sp.]
VSRQIISTIRIPAQERPMIAVKTMGGFWRAGYFHSHFSLSGKAIARDPMNRIVCGIWQADSIVTGVRKDSLGVYRGQMNSSLLAHGQGSYDAVSGSHYEGFWQDDACHGFGFESATDHQVRIGTWKFGQFLGEKMKYTTERIYGIDISRHQHEKGRKRYGIDWSKLRITSLGKRHNAGGLTFPVSFVYIKSTEGTTVRNRYFATDYQKAKKHGIHVGAYHFFSTKSTAEAQATYFLRNTIFRNGDFPPVLDVEPSDAQIRQIGGHEELLHRVRTFMQIVEKHTGMRPILYVSQMFVKKYMQQADDLKHNYNVWIARYGEYRPDVKLVYWQLCPDGRVDGISGDVDINVFNGYQGQWEDFLHSGFHQ